jgi:hypothetical protein
MSNLRGSAPPAASAATADSTMAAVAIRLLWIVK